MSFLTESQTVALAQLNVKEARGTISDAERWERTLLRTDQPLPSHRLSLGGRAATGLAFKSLAAKGLSPNMLTEDVPLTSVRGAEFKTLLRQGSATSIGAFQSIGVGEYEPVRRPLQLLDLVRLGSTEEASVQYMRQTSYTSAAVETAEATSVTTGTIPEATLPFEAVSSPVESIDSWVPASRRALADVDEMRGLIDDQLLFDARRRLEAQLLAGNGTTPNLKGLDSTTGVQTQAKGADSVPLALAKGIALCIVAGFTPTAVVLHPDDWTDAIGPLITAGGTLSGILEVPVVKTASVAAGTGYVGAWNQLVVWLRDSAVYVSISHSDYLIHNLAAVMGEIRCAVGVLAPAAFARVTGI